MSKKPHTSNIAMDHSNNACGLDMGSGGHAAGTVAGAGGSALGNITATMNNHNLMLAAGGCTGAAALPSVGAGALPFHSTAVGGGAGGGGAGPTNGYGGAGGGTAPSIHSPHDGVVVTPSIGETVTVIGAGQHAGITTAVTDSTRGGGVSFDGFGKMTPSPGYTFGPVTAGDPPASLGAASTAAVPPDYFYPSMKMPSPAPAAREVEDLTDPNTPDYYKIRIGSTIFDADILIDVLGLGFRLGNAVKYILRAGRKTKETTSDLKKARHYIDRVIKAQ